ncbi:NAD(P)H-hydrate dehydratase [Acinetobacter rudis]|uniref:NAD(P)H-hydrate dehydratase n=1 Tax=Acinetobacter rudis TaxID=632955 RepID=UPI00281036C5|nr:NAD(P)H-hydrate dehydratase [Acinetobacter rudis]MDQ8953457.1 NAD(P)H-hydrate dehydratase [Acinetobacter rudis]
MMQFAYSRQDIKTWEQRWFSQQNSSFALMQQVAWTLHKELLELFKDQNKEKFKIALCCGQGNNAGDGYLVAVYLKRAGFLVDIYAAELGQSLDLAKARQCAENDQINIISGFDFKLEYDCYVDALFGIGLDRPLNEYWQNIIHNINSRVGIKITIDIPSGLNANTGRALPCAIKADYCFTVLGLKIGLLTGQAQEYTGQIKLLDLIPIDSGLIPLAYISPTHIKLNKRKAYGHKGDYGHVVIVGGHEQMGGAVIMAAEAASCAGAAKVTVVCHAKHHVAILSRSPNLMLRDIDRMTISDIQELLQQIDAVCIGMGLGRDQWAEQHFTHWFAELNRSSVDVVYDADALWFLAKYPSQLKIKSYATPHPGEAATLLQQSVATVESDRVAAIKKLQQNYGGQWVLKGSGSLILQEQLWVCRAGNPGMATGGMGDILAGMIAGLKAQMGEQIALHQIVTLHALAGDALAQYGMRGMRAQKMIETIYDVVNLE